MQIHEFMAAIMSEQAFDYLQRAITTASVCIALIMLGALYVNVLAN
jgi:hypothetical protein